jgi:DNA-binding HxlR family transcriptional regulator
MAIEPTTFQSLKNRSLAWEAYQQPVPAAAAITLTPQDFNVLKLLQKSQGVATELQLSSQLGISQTELAQKLALLNSSGFVTRKIPPVSRNKQVAKLGSKINLVRLSSQGRNAMLNVATGGQEGT